MATPEPIPFFTDNCVPDSVGRAIQQAGHSLTRLRDCMATDTKDPVIAIACAQGGHVLVSHDNDFKQVAKRLQITQGQARQRLHRVDLRCDEPDGARRILELMTLIEHEWRLAHEESRAMIIEIRGSSVRIER